METIKISSEHVELNTLCTISIGDMSQQSPAFSSIYDSFCSKFHLFFFPSDRWLLQCNDTRMWGCIPAIGCNRLLCVCTCRVLELQLLLLFNSIFNSINTGFAGPRFSIGWRDGDLMFINGFRIWVQWNPPPPAKKQKQKQLQLVCLWWTEQSIK